MKYIISIVVIAAVIAGIWYVSSDRTPVPKVSGSPSLSESASVRATPTVSVVPSKSVTPATPTPTAQASTTPKASSGPTSYTAAQVAQHGSQSSCWSIISGSIYDLTSYIPKHPGGSRQIIDICGKDGSSLFDGQHSGQSKPENILASYLIGMLAR